MRTGHRFVTILLTFLFLFLIPSAGFGQEDKFTFLIENGARMIRENEIEKVFNLIAELSPEKRGDFRVRVIENFVNLKAYLISKRKEYGKKWQVDYKHMVYTGNKIATPILADLLKDGDPYIRAFTARALGYLGDQRALEEVKKVADHDPNSKVRSRAQWAYEHISGGKIPQGPLKED